MSNQMMKGAVIFLLGVGSGGTAAYLLGTRELRKRISELELQKEDLAKENSRLNDRSGKIRRAKERVEKENVADSVEVAVDDSKIKHRRISEENDILVDDPEEERNMKINYAKLSQQYSSESFDEHFADRVGPSDEDDEEPEGEKRIRIMTPEEFEKDMPYRDNDTIYYYKQDDVLVDSHNMIFKDQEKVIGADGMGLISSTDDEYVYVDNEIENRMYEIIVNHNESFYRDIMGG